NKLISYNRKDVELVYKIDEKCKLISIFDDIKRYAGVRNLNDCFFASRIHETRMMKKYRDVVFPTIFILLHCSPSSQVIFPAYLFFFCN
ncbi:unnamed protein product, partial [marine sediment metagenome]